MPFRFSLVALLLLAAAGCDSLRLDGDTTFTGTVLDEATSAPLSGAVVTAAGVSDTTDVAGAYSITVPSDSSGQSFTLTISAPGYETETVAARADVGETVTVPEQRLARTPLGGPGGTPGGLPGGSPNGSSGPANSITLAARSTEVIGVTGAGGIETAALEFIVLDADGRAVDLTNAVDLDFVIANGPGGGETISPESANTGADGRSQLTLTSGTRAGTVQVLATGTVDGREIRSLPVTITITGGLPDDDHFSVSVGQFNFAGYNISGLTNPVTAYVGDKYGNPVQPGTAVYFTTDGGIIPGSGITNAQGTTTVNLLSAAPRPSNPSPGGCSANSQGYGRVTASTSDENQARIEDSAVILFSGETQIELGEDGLRIGPYSYTVADQFGHPLAPGSSITVTADGVNIKATGDVAVSLGDFLCPGDGRTEFRFGIAKDDPSADADDPVLESITISVSSPNGNAQLTRTSAGRRANGATSDVFERF